MAFVLECVVNISEGRDAPLIETLAGACGDDLLDLHTDEFHHRSVFTLVGVEAPRSLATQAVRHLDLGSHRGVHPRIGVVDVVPFVPLAGSTMQDACEARDAFGIWAARTLGLPSFCYGPERSLPDVRREAFRSLGPDFGPDHPHRSAGACAIGARPPLVAFNVWVEAPDLRAVRRVATALRSEHVRTLGLPVGSRYQISCNLVAPHLVGPGHVADSVSEVGAPEQVRVTGCELVGLLPDAVLRAIDPSQWPRLDLSADRTIEARIKRNGQCRFDGQ